MLIPVFIFHTKNDPACLYLFLPRLQCIVWKGILPQKITIFYCVSLNLSIFVIHQNEMFACDLFAGRSNAYTAQEHTNYKFDVAADYLEPALDRFAAQPSTLVLIEFRFPPSEDTPDLI